MAKIFEFDVNNTVASAGSLTSTIGNDWTVVRNSEATYQPTPSTVVKVGNHVPRIQDGKVLIEGFQENKVRSSENLTVAQWTYDPSLGVTGSLEGTIPAPDGTLTATRLTLTSTGGYVIQDQQGLLEGEYKTLFVRTVSGTASVSIVSHNTSVNNPSSINETWQRITNPVVVGESGQTTLYAVDSRAYDKDIDILVWGADAKNGVLSSYVPNLLTTGVGTREADVITNTVPSGGTAPLTLTKVVDGVESSETVTAGQTLTMENGTESIIITDSSSTGRNRKSDLILLKKIRR